MPILERLATLADVGMVVDPDAMSPYLVDEARWVKPGRPLAVVLPGTTEAVCQVMRLASAHRVPVVPRGAGTGLSGGATASDGCLVLALARMDQILSIDTATLTAVVQPGVLTGDLKRRVADLGLFYPPDPSSAAISTVGGNVATNAGGLCCVRYGVTGDFVASLRVVLADGSLVATGSLAPKSVAGYDLTSLFVGSEGTLGVVTEATLRLVPAPSPTATLVGLFGRLADAVEAIQYLTSHTRPVMVEIMDQPTVAAIETMMAVGLDLSAEATVIARIDEEGLDPVALQLGLTQRGASYVAISEDAVEADMLMEARRMAFPALQALGDVLLDDVSVPVSKVGDLVRSIADIARHNQVRIATFGHAADGNLHPTIIYDSKSTSQEAAAQAAFADVLTAALALGGSITGEHGVGVLKKRFLGQELGTSGLELTRRLKEAFDPLGILNPGKVVDLLPGTPSDLLAR
jgi:glycolate oxidase